MRFPKVRKLVVGAAGLGVGLVGTVGVITLLPIGGPVGTIAGAGAAIGSCIGSLIGCGASVKIDEAVTDAEKRGQERGQDIERATARATYEKKVSQLEARLATLMKDASDNHRHAFVIAGFGFAACACDGVISDNEKSLIMRFVFGKTHSYLPSNCLSRVEQLATSPPTFEEAVTAFESLGQGLRVLVSVDIGEVLEVAIRLRSQDASRRLSFRSQWQEYLAAPGCRV